MIIGMSADYGRPLKALHGNTTVGRDALRAQAAGDHGLI
jgi:hypothetical protein